MDDECKLYSIQMAGLKRAIEHLQTLDLDHMLICARAIGEEEDAKRIELARHLIAQLPKGHH